MSARSPPRVDCQSEAENERVLGTSVGLVDFQEVHLFIPHSTESCCCSKNAVPKVVPYGTLGIILISSSCCFSAKQKTYFLKSPGKVTYGHEGSDVTMEWDFSIEARPPSGTKIYDLIFGEWVSMPPGSGYVKHKILYMDVSRDRVKKRPGYEDKVDWSANVPQCVNCSAKVTLHNLTQTDFKKYGIDIFLGLHRNQLKHCTELRAPPRIINWFPLLEVNEGNTTVISCKAEGIPSPFVTLQRGNQTFCNGTEYCEYTIQKARAVDGGEYGCFAEQGKEKSVKRSMQLKVHAKGLKRATAMPSTAIRTLIFCLVALAVIVLLMAIIIFILYKRKINRQPNVNEVEEKPINA